MKPGKDFIGVGCGALIINEKEETLLIKRTKRNDIGSWSQPGGTVEFGETIEEAIKREIREELGVEIDLIRSLGYIDHIFPAEGQHWVAFAYLARIKEGEPKNAVPDVTEEIGWFPIDALPQPLTQPTEHSVREYLLVRDQES